MARMSSSDLDRRLAGWLESERADYVPTGLLEDVYSVTRVSRQRRGALGRLVTAARQLSETPMLSRVPPQVVYLALAVLVLLAAALAIAFVGASRTAPPFGLAANGNVAFQLDGAIVIAHPDGTEISRLTTVPDARGPVFSPDGSHLAFFGTIDGDKTILVASADGRDPIPISDGVDISSSAPLDDPAGNGDPPISWSPDSRQIAFSGRSGTQLRLFVAKVDGTDTRPVGDDTLSRLDPAWSPDGAWIAFHGFRPEEDAAAGQYRTTAGLYLIRPDGRDQTLLVEGTGGDFLYRKPQWLPDPDRSILAYQVGEPSRYDIAVFDVGAGTQAVITGAGAVELWPKWSPDGSALAWGASDGKIRVARPDGTILQVLPGSIDYELVWSPDGRFLFGYATGDHADMAVMSVDGSSATTTFPLQGQSLSFWSWQRRAP
jgi:Tol biopolymer transport system component